MVLLWFFFFSMQRHKSLTLFFSFSFSVFDCSSSCICLCFSLFVLFLSFVLQLFFSSLWFSLSSPFKMFPFSFLVFLFFFQNLSLSSKLSFMFPVLFVSVSSPKISFAFFLLFFCFSPLYSLFFFRSLAPKSSIHSSPLQKIFLIHPSCFFVHIISLKSPCILVLKKISLIPNRPPYFISASICIYKCRRRGAPYPYHGVG